MAREVHGQALARILQRDADMIGTQLKLLSKVLATYAEWIGARNDIEIKEFYRESVVKPFAATGDLPAGWDQDVRTYLRGSSLAEQLVKALSQGESGRMTIERRRSCIDLFDNGCDAVLSR